MKCAMLMLNYPQPSVNVLDCRALTSLYIAIKPSNSERIDQRQDKNTGWFSLALQCSQVIPGQMVQAGDIIPKAVNLEYDTKKDIPQINSGFTLLFKVFKVLSLSSFDLRYMQLPSTQCGIENANYDGRHSYQRRWESVNGNLATRQSARSRYSQCRTCRLNSHITAELLLSPGTLTTRQLHEYQAPEKLTEQLDMKIVVMAHYQKLCLG